MSVISDCLIHHLGSPWAEPWKRIRICILVTMIFYGNALHREVGNVKDCPFPRTANGSSTGTRATVGATVLKIAVDCDGVVGDNTVIDGGKMILERVDIDLGIGEFLFLIVTPAYQKVIGTRKRPTQLNDHCSQQNIYSICPQYTRNAQFFLKGYQYNVNHKQSSTRTNHSYSFHLSPLVAESVALSLGWSRTFTIGTRLPNNVRLNLFEVLVLEPRACSDGNGALPDGVVCWRERDRLVCVP